MPITHLYLPHTLLFHICSGFHILRFLLSVLLFSTTFYDMYKTSGGFPRTPKIPNQVLPPSPSPVYTATTTRPHYNYGSFTAPTTSIPLRSTTPSPEYYRPRRDSSSSRSHDTTNTRMRRNSGPSDTKPLKSILKKTVDSVINTFRSSSRVETTRPLANGPRLRLALRAFLTIVLYTSRKLFSDEGSYSSTGTSSDASSFDNGRSTDVLIYRSRSRDHSTTRSTEDHLMKPHRSSSRKDYPAVPPKHRSVTSSDSGAASDYEVMKVHRKHHHSSHHSSKSRSSGTSSSDSGHMSDSTPNFKVKAIYANKPPGGHRYPLTPNTHPPRSRLSKGCGEEWENSSKHEAISLMWPLVGERLNHKGHVQACPLYFDVAFEPWYNVSIWSATEKRARKFFPAQQECPASPRTLLTEMTIFCDMMDMWPVRVVRKEGIRCLDVFDAIYRTYAVPVTDKEKQILGPEVILRSEAAFSQRIRDGPGLPYVNERLGVLRVDTLANYRIFGGLVQNGEDWKLILKDPRH
ncbi:hypothetical protein D9758_014356 [Tetrapyrgos nigripes]|uniref:DUF6699 domain-containing protein n=1 Tax=Tetrapyrgos nigripes TaxID=182062 RepID=A0A8H5C6Q2_9AGAR|nr:hypothetical protein D9758_014356 [Tetrapyrgos nigripes]